MNPKLVINVACASLLLAAAACSDDKNQGVVTPDSESVSLYMSVKIKDSSSLSRADEVFEYGSTTEQNVSSADFWFYDEAGYYVAKAEVWGGGDATDEDPNGNIEFEANTVIVLNNVTQKSYPKYMVTALNFPAGFTPANTLTGLASQLTDLATAGGTIENGAFLMTTSSYTNGVNVDGFDMPFVNALNDSDFVTVNTEVEDISPVEVYVERLAVKVRVTIDDDLKETYVRGLGYPLGITIAGNSNDDPNKDNVGDTQIYIELLGWGLNVTAKNTLLVKDIETSWTNDDLGFVWNVNDYHRSYWGKSYNYGKDVINESYGGSDYLKYSTFTGIKNNFGVNDYCAENTNTASMLNDNDYTALVTSVLVAAKIVDENGEELNLIRYNGVLFTYDAFKAYILNRVNPNFYTKNEDGQTYTQIGSSDCRIAGNNGGVYLKLNLQSGTYYSKSGDTFTEINDLDDRKSACNEMFKAYKGNAYHGGKMYYNIPLTHLRASQEGKIQEGEYGVVRNHIYSININALETIGVGIYNPGKHTYYDPTGEYPDEPEDPDDPTDPDDPDYPDPDDPDYPDPDDPDDPDPDEPIIPDPNDPEYYKVGADINILSWRVVNINTSL